ncbi:MAG: triose-phosphate isomerase [Pseudomonadota bacterium]
MSRVTQAGRRPLVVGNWKMFGRLTDLDEVAALEGALGGLGGADIVICPPFTLLTEAARRFVASPVAWGAQDVSAEPDGPRTGDVSAEMLADCGAQYVIVGHSERRRDHGESDLLVGAKAARAIEAGLIPIICVGETIEQRKAGQASAVVTAQAAACAPALGAFVLAYEPVWAIGTGLTPTIAEIAEIHAVLRGALGEERAAATPLLYGGSVKAANAAEIFSADNVDGALVGGASLKAADFSAIIASHPAARA